jgi:hypothetical protein
MQQQVQQRPPGLPTGLPGGLTLQQQQQLFQAQAMQQQQQQQQKGAGRAWAPTTYLVMVLPARFHCILVLRVGPGCLKAGQAVTRRQGTTVFHQAAGVR